MIIEQKYLNVRKPVSGFSTRSNTNRAVQPQKMDRGLKLVKRLHSLIAKTKALISFRVTAKLVCIFVFTCCKKPVFT